jgi:uncharacterized protein YecT (DUF1311 family)
MQVAVLWSVLDARARRAFSRAHDAWLAYRDQDCRARARARVGGSAEPIVYGQCEVELTAARVKDVKSTLALYCEGAARVGPYRRCPHS